MGFFVANGCARLRELLVTDKEAAQRVGSLICIVLYSIAGYAIWGIP